MGKKPGSGPCLPLKHLQQHQLCAVADLLVFRCTCAFFRRSCFESDASGWVLQEAANRALCSLSRSDAATAQAVLDTGLVFCIKQQLDGTDASVKEAGLAAIAALAATSADMAAAVLDRELLDKIVTVLSGPAADSTLLEAACGALAAHAAQTAALARAILDANAAPALVSVLQGDRGSDPRLQAAVLRCLSQLAHHETAAASTVAEAGMVPLAMRSVVDEFSAPVRHAAAALLQRIATRTPALSGAVASEGCVVALLESLKLDRGSSFALAPVTALGHIAAFGATFAQAVRCQRCCCSSHDSLHRRLQAQIAMQESVQNQVCRKPDASQDQITCCR